MVHITISLKNGFLKNYNTDINVSFKNAAKCLDKLKEKFQIQSPSKVIPDIDNDNKFV